MWAFAVWVKISLPRVAYLFLRFTVGFLFTTDFLQACKWTTYCIQTIATILLKEKIKTCNQYYLISLLIVIRNIKEKEFKNLFYIKKASRII